MRITGVMTIEEIHNYLQGRLIFFVIEENQIFGVEINTIKKVGDIPMMI